MVAAWTIELAHQGGRHISIGCVGKVDGVTLGPDRQAGRTKELLKNHVLILAAEGGQLVEDDGRGEGSL